MTYDRKAVLLRAAFDMLRKCEMSHYVISPMETIVFYDDAECDGSCLLEDIAIELDIEPDTTPFKVPADHWSRKEKLA